MKNESEYQKMCREFGKANKEGSKSPYGSYKKREKSNYAQLEQQNKALLNHVLDLEERLSLIEQYIMSTN